MIGKQGNPGRGKLRGCLTMPFVWWFRGRWWVKTIKLTVLAVILYNVVTFVLMWCPPVKGVVLDIDTGQPIAGAIVQKKATGEFAALFVMSEANGRVGGGEAQAVTAMDGRFAFPGTFAHPTRKTYSAWVVHYPFQWLDSVDITVWQENYIGVSSYKLGMWWREETPRRSRGYCKVTRYRIPILGFRYKIFLKKPVTEAEWQVKIGSVNLGGIEGGQADENERLFNDLTGYLERWPKGEKAGLYYSSVWSTAVFGGCDYLRDEWARGHISKKVLLRKYKRAEKIIEIAKKIDVPHDMTEESFKKGIEQHKQEADCAGQLLGMKMNAEGDEAHEMP